MIDTVLSINVSLDQLDVALRTTGPGSANKMGRR